VIFHNGIAKQRCFARVGQAFIRVLPYLADQKPCLTVLPARRAKPPKPDRFIQPPLIAWHLPDFVFSMSG